MKDWNVRQDTIKLLEGHAGRTLFDINWSSNFLDPSPKVKEAKAKKKKQTKNKNQKQDLIKCKSFCTAKKTIHKWKDSLLK